MERWDYICSMSPSCLHPFVLPCSQFCAPELIQVVRRPLSPTCALLAELLKGMGIHDCPHGRRSSRNPLRRPRPRELRAFFSCMHTPSP